MACMLSSCSHGHYVLSDLDGNLKAIKINIVNWTFSMEVHEPDNKLIPTLLSMPGHLVAMLDHLDCASTPSVEDIPEDMEDRKFKQW